MSWSDAQPHRKLLALAAGVALLTLSACGFRPLYGTQNTASTALSGIEVAPIRDRNGQLIYNSLTTLLSQMPDGKPQYRLLVDVSQQTGTVTVSSDGRATRAQLAQSTAFNLVNLSGDVVYKGSTTVSAAHDVSSQYFSSTISERDAMERASRQTAEQIVAQLAAYFAK